MTGGGPARKTLPIGWVFFDPRVSVDPRLPSGYRPMAAPAVVTPPTARRPEPTAQPRPLISHFSFSLNRITA